MSNKRTYSRKSTQTEVAVRNTTFIFTGLGVFGLWVLSGIVAGAVGDNKLTFLRNEWFLGVLFWGGIATFAYGLTQYRKKD